MAKLHQIGNVSIRVYANDHLPPHFHIDSPDAGALVVIETMTVKVGELPASHGAAALAWSVSNRDRIEAEWNRTNPRFPI